MFNHYRPTLNQILLRCLSVGTLSTLSLLLGFAPSLSVRKASIDFSSQALAQSAETLETRYARALLKIEPIRQTAYNKIKQKTGGNVPPISCHNRSTLDSLPAEAREIAEDFCEKSDEIVKKNQLSSDDFNRITMAIAGNPPADPTLKDKIQKELLRLQ